MGLSRGLSPLGVIPQSAGISGCLQQELDGVAACHHAVLSAIILNMGDSKKNTTDDLGTLELAIIMTVTGALAFGAIVFFAFLLGMAGAKPNGSGPLPWMP